MLENEIVEVLTPENCFVNIPLARQHTFYLSGTIKSPENYTKWFHAIRNASENDIVMIHINSSGGDASTAIQFMRVMTETPATVVASVEGNCMSAATMVFLAADSYQISEHSCFMFHNYSGMSMGKGGEMYDNIVFERKWSEKMLKSIYKDFLTEKEINDILNNRDIWLDSDEVIKRLERRAKKMAKKGAANKEKIDERGN
jgi:ATP-dependent protease ClpP protease subunit